MRPHTLLLIAALFECSMIGAGDITLPMTPREVPDAEPAPAPEPVAPTPDQVPVNEIIAGQLYVVQSDVPLITLQSPEGFVKITHSDKPVTVFGRFSDEPTVDALRTFNSPHVYMLQYLKPGTTELVLIPEGVQSEADIIRQVLTVSGSGPQPPPGPKPEPGPKPGPVPGPEPQPGPIDPNAISLSPVFEAYRSAWIAAQQELARQLDGGAITSEAAATAWFRKANAAAMSSAFSPLANTEFDAFGGDKWTPKAHADYIRRYTP